MILVVSGYILRVVSFAFLKDKTYWKIKVPSKIVSSGPYKYIRHPMYLGTLLMMAGFSWLATKQIGLSILLTYMTLNFVIERIDREENILISVFGEFYINYMKKTKRLIPFIW
jgi:protein-S-isoprenylcysteine O-methyltransferase Ste14